MNVRLVFCLNEGVTPEHLALRVAQACAAYGALRPGEQVSDEAANAVYTISERPVHPLNLRPLDVD